MARRLIGTGTTDSNGRVTVSYSGKGAGKLQLVAVSGNLVSETYEVEDCYWVETGSTISGMYSNSGGTLTLNDGVFSLTKGSGTSYFYLNIPKTNLPIADFQGKGLTVKADVTSLDGAQFRMGITLHNGTSWGTTTNVDVTTTGTMENTVNIPSNTTQVRIRFDISGNEGVNVTFNNFRILLS